MKVGVVREERYLLHQTGLVHPENPARLEAVYRMLDDRFQGTLTRIEPRMATLEELELVHTPAHIKKVMATAGKEFTYLAPDTPASTQTYLAAWLAVGGCLQALEAVLSGRCRAAFALVRPPGHHALPDQAAGFCIFNNLGIAARKALRDHGLKRILIVDWDVHHGNALQELFYDESEVLYFSFHYQGWWPHTGDMRETGRGPGLGYNINLPIPKEVTDADLIHACREVLNAVVRAYRPELILVAAGFDAHREDPLGRTGLSSDCFRWLTYLLAEAVDTPGGPPILLALEGGYHPPALAESVAAVLKTLADYEDGVGDGRRPEELTVTTPLGGRLVAEARQAHAAYGVWV